MRRTLLILQIILSCALPLLAQVKTDTKQPKCTLPLERAPELRGFRLGTPQASVLLRFPGTSLGKPDKFGITQIQLTVIDTTAFSKGPGSRDKGVQPDMTAGSGEDSAFIVDSAKFPALNGVRRVRVRFVDGRLAYAQVAYDDSIRWDSIDEFVESVTMTLKLPGDWGRPANSDSANAKELRCEGFVLTGDVGSDSLDTRIAAQLSVEDLGVSKLVEKRQNDLKDKAKRDEEAKRKNFKP